MDFIEQRLNLMKDRSSVLQRLSADHDGFTCAVPKWYEAAVYSHN